MLGLRKQTLDRPGGGEADTQNYDLRKQGKGSIG